MAAGRFAMLKRSGSHTPACETGSNRRHVLPGALNGSAALARRSSRNSGRDGAPSAGRLLYTHSRSSSNEVRSTAVKVRRSVWFNDVAVADTLAVVASAFALGGAFTTVRESSVDGVTPSGASAVHRAALFMESMVSDGISLSCAPRSE